MLYLIVRQYIFITTKLQVELKHCDVTQGAVAGYSPCMPVGTIDVRLSKNKRGKNVVTVPFLTASLLGQLFIASWLKWLIVMQDIRVQILAGPKYYSTCKIALESTTTQSYESPCPSDKTNQIPVCLYGLKALYRNTEISFPQLKAY